MTDLVLATGVMLAAGLPGGWLAQRFRFPMVTDYIVVGVMPSPCSVAARLESFTWGCK